MDSIHTPTLILKLDQALFNRNILKKTAPCGRMLYPAWGLSDNLIWIATYTPSYGKYRKLNVIDLNGSYITKEALRICADIGDEHGSFLTQYIFISRFQYKHWLNYLAVDENV